MGSEQTPRGMHRIDKKIGEGAAVNTVFVGRKPTGEIWTPELAQANPTRDWIVTRILWLAGCESGINRGYNNEDKNVDSHERYIYLHGTPDPACLGTPSSHGCIRLANDDMIGLFDKVSEGTTVCINP
jgi:L,D-transpeptidase YbiS